MKKTIITSLSILLLAGLLSGCAGARPSDVGLVGGGVAGALIGGAVTGSKTGTAIGAVGGALIGKKLSEDPYYGY